MPLLRQLGNSGLVTAYSSFQSVENILSKTVNLLLKNERLKQLLYYSDRHALAMTRLNEEQTHSLIGNQIKIVPKITVDPDVKPYLILSLDNFVPEPGQTTFRSFQLIIDVLCPFDYWVLDDFKLRPYAIAGEVDAMINNSSISGPGVADFVGAKQLLLDYNIGGLSLYYNVETLGDDTKRYI